MDRTDYLLWVMAKLLVIIAQILLARVSYPSLEISVDKLDNTLNYIESEGK